MTKQQERKQVIRKFMREFYTDERLAQLLAHAQDGKLTYCSCCCLIGLRTAQHALEGANENWIAYAEHESPHNALSGDASEAYCNLGIGNDPKRRRILIPMIRAEFKRRGMLAKREVVDGRTAHVAV